MVATWRGGRNVAARGRYPADASGWGRRRRPDADRHHHLAPVQPEDGGVRSDHREVVRERLHVAARLRLHLDAQAVLVLAGIRDVEHVHRAAEDDRPPIGLRDRPQRVLARRERLSLDEHVAADGDRGRRVGAGMPDLAPPHHAVVPEQRATPRHGPVVLDRDDGEAHALAHRAVLAERDALGARGGRRRDQRRSDQRPYTLHPTPCTLSHHSPPNHGYPWSSQ